MRPEGAVLLLQSIEGGYTVDFRVHKAASSQAEIKLDIESAGHWFGGGMSQ